MFDVSEFAAGKRQDKLIKCLLKLEEIAKKSGIEAGENVLALQAQIEEEDQKKSR
jgi:predicted HAD superfamily hydrolase